mgnify:FL=1
MTDTNNHVRKWVEADTFEAAATAEIARLRKLVIKGLGVVNDFLPNIGQCALQDYEGLNMFCVEAEAEKRRMAERG